MQQICKDLASIGQALEKIMNFEEKQQGCVHLNMMAYSSGIRLGCSNWSPHIIF